MVNREGFGKGRTVAPYQTTGEGHPLLSTFYFRFHQRGTGQRVDNHINEIQVMPGGGAEDESPSADIPVSNVGDDRIELTYQDDDPDDVIFPDNYYYRVAHDVKTTNRYSFRDVGCVGSCQQSLPLPNGIPTIDDGIFALIGFRLFFTGDRDHHIDEVGVFEENGELTVKFNDRNNDDTFAYEVQYTWLRPVRQNINLGFERGLASGGDRRFLPPGNKIIRGFEFDFETDDNHLRDIGVVTSSDRLEIFYGDDEADKPFRWNVSWATVEPFVIGPAVF